MDSFAFHDGSISNLIDSRSIHLRHDVNQKLHMHSSVVQRLSLERELEGHLGCVNTIAWNSPGSLLISGSDDTRINIWRYSDRKLLNCIDTGHSSNIFCTKFVPETSDEIVASGAGDAEVRVFNISRLSGSSGEETSLTPSAHFQCHSRRVKKLAVEVGNPNVIWSASEDGTLRQHDLREGCSCPPAGASNQECRNVLLDLRGAAKKSLAEPPKQPLQIKSCDISTTMPHLLLVGGSDAFARLYDRRMLPPLSSCRRKISPPPCVNYFCPMHLSERGRSSLHLTHVTFSPNGEEVLISYSGEHVYLMDINQGSGGIQYTSGDVAKLSSFSPILNGVNLEPGGSSLSTHDKNSTVRGYATVQLDKCRKLMKLAEKCLHEESNYYYGIEACNEVLDGGYKIDPMLKHDCLCLRAALLLKRKWKNDAHIAVKDLNAARRINSSSLKALLYMSEALSQLGKHKEALDFALAAKCMDPSGTEVAERVESIQKQLSSAKDEKKSNDGGPKSEPRAGRVISLSDILYRSEANSDASQDGPRSEREDSDYDEELELDFETSVSGDEGRDVDSNVLHGSLNLRIHRRPESSKEAIGSNGSSGSPSFSNRNNKTSYQPETVIDMKQRYIGHCNVGTDIKQASFLGQNGNYVASGSDDGRWFIWEKKTGRLIKMLLGDEAVVNCIQCHPFDSVVATSGIDSTIKIWTPTASFPSMVAGGSTGPDTAKFLDAMEGNQQRLCRTRDAILPFELLERFRMHDFTEGTMHPFECAQS